MDPLDGRIALVGHIRATSPVVSGSLRWTDARRVVLEALSHLRDRIRSYKDVQGTIVYRVEVRTAGTVESITTLTDNVVTPITGYEHSDSVASVKSHIQQVMSGLKFPESHSRSSVTVPVLVPVPDLRPIEIAVPHEMSHTALCEWIMRPLGDDDELALQGTWEGDTFVVREPIAGSIRIEPRLITVSFDPPMWVPSQRESFQTALSEWAKAVPGPS